MAINGWTSPVVGVLGGMGPVATVAFLELLVSLTEAERDQDHIDSIVSLHSTTPDRSSFILQPDAVDPTPVLVADAQRLQAVGADLLVAPCNTVCYYWPAIEDAVSIPCLSIVDVTAAQAAGQGSVGIMATAGTIAAGLYQQAIERHGATAVVPSIQTQASISSVISAVKAGLVADTSLFNQCVDDLLEAGAKTVILGCTELSIINDRGEEVIDSLRALAMRVIAETGHQVRELQVPA